MLRTPAVRLILVLAPARSAQAQWPSPSQGMGVLSRKMAAQRIRCHGHAQSSARQNQFANCLVPSRAHARTWTNSESKCAACAERLKLTADCLTVDPNRIIAKVNRGYQVLEPNH